MLITVLALKAIPLSFCVLLETVSPMKRYSLRDRFPGALFILLPTVFAIAALAPMRAAWAALGVAPLVDISGWGPLALFCATLVASDFFNYWQHRFDHWLLWPIHSVHHSATELHASNGYTHPFQMFSEFVYITIPLSLIHVGNYTWPIVATLFVAVQSMVVHSPLRVHLGPFRRVFVDSRFHRIHHSLELRHFNRNFGTVFTFWDQIFGTAHFPAKDEWPDVGVEGIIPPTTVVQYILAPLKFTRWHNPQAKALA